MDAKVAVGQVGYGALFARGQYLIPADRGGLGDALDFFDSPPFEVLESRPVEALVDRFSVNLVWPEAVEGDGYDSLSGRALEWFDAENPLVHLRLPDVHREHWTFSRIRNGSGGLAFVLKPASEGPVDRLDIPREEWEIRFWIGTGLEWGDGQVAGLLSIEKRVGEGSRRTVWQAEQLSAMGSSASVLVLGGNCIEGRSWIEGQRYNLHRPMTWRTLSEFPSPLMVPATSELAAPPDELAAEAEAAGVTLLSANLAAPETGELFFRPYFRADIGGIDTAIVGLTPPSAAALLTPDVAAQLDITDPTAALLAVTHELSRSEQGPPALLILATALDRSELSEVVESVPGFDIVLTPTASGAIRDLDTTARAQPGHASGQIDFTDRSPLLWAEGQWGLVGAVDVYGEGGTVVELTSRIRAVEQHWSPQQSVLGPVNAVRHDLYARQEASLFPDLAPLVRADDAIRAVFLRGHQETIAQLGHDEDDFVSQFATAFSWTLWLNYVANTVKTWTDADVALVRHTQQPIALTGDIQELFVHAFLQDDDEVWLYSLPGSVLSEVLETRGTAQQGATVTDGGFLPPIASGAAWADGKVGGRTIDTDARYHLAISSYLATHPDYASSLGDLEPTKRFRIEGDHLERDSDGDTIMLHRLIVQDLEARRLAHPELGADYLDALADSLRDPGTARVPLFIFRIADVAFSLSQVSRQLSKNGFDSVRNTRVKQADSLTLTAGGTLSGSFDTEGIVATLEASTKYGELRVDDEVTETSDDLQATLDIQLRALSFGAADTIMPYVASRYDTELTPAENDDGSEQPRQSELRNSTGLIGQFSDVVPEFRAGLFHQLDFAAESGAQSFGAELVLEQKASLGPVSQAFSLDAAYFLPSDDDTEEDLSFLIESSLSLAIPIVSSLSIETYVDTLWFRGQLPSNDDIGLSLIVGVGLRVDEVVRVRLD